MKIFFLIVSIITLNSESVFAQQAEAFKKGSSTISLGYGVHNIWKALFKQTTSLSGTKYKISSTGPFSFIYEYGFTHRISGGVSLGYSEAKRELYFSTSTNTETLNNFSILARANYHLWKSKKLDPYVGLGLGYYKFKFTSVDNTGSSTPSGINVPGAFGFSVQGGLKYYIAPVIGAFVEAGYVAGSYGQVGVTVRF